MLQYERVDISEEININKARVSKECIICHYWYFKYIGYKFEPGIYNGCHDVLMMTYELKNIAILNEKSFDYVFYGI